MSKGMGINLTNNLGDLELRTRENPSKQRAQPETGHENPGMLVELTASCCINDKTCSCWTDPQLQSAEMFGFMSKQQSVLL